MAHCSEPLLVGTAVDGYKAFTVAAAVLGEKAARGDLMYIYTRRSALTMTPTLLTCIYKNALYFVYFVSSICKESIC